MNKTILAAIAAAISLNATAMTKSTTRTTLRIIETSDVHGSFFPYDYINRQPQRGTLARVSSYA